MRVLCVLLLAAGDLVRSGDLAVVRSPPSLSTLSPDVVRQTAGRPRRVRGVAAPVEEVEMPVEEEDEAEVSEAHHPLSLMGTQTLLMIRSASTAPSPRAHLIVCAGLFILVVVLSISAVMVGDDGPRGKRRAQPPAETHGETQPSVLVPSLVVPRGKEFLFAIKSVVTGGRQTERFDMVDPENKPFCSVLVSESGAPHPSPFRGLYGILLEHGGESLAFLHTEDWHTKKSPVCPLHRRDGELFGYLMRDRDPPRRYSIVAPHTGDTLLSFHGDFREQSVNVHNGHGQLVATTERQAFAFALDRYVQVRVAPCVDASPVMLGLLGIAKME